MHGQKNIKKLYCFGHTFTFLSSISWVCNSFLLTRKASFSLIFISTFLLFFLFAITQGASTQQRADLLVTVNTDVPTLSS